MNRNNKKELRKKKEEQQARKVMTIIGISALILVLVMLIAYSFLGN